MRKADQGGEARGDAIILEFGDNALAAQIYGDHHRFLARIEQKLGVTLIPRGNVLAIRGPSAAAETARTVLTDLYDKALHGETIGEGDLDGALRMAPLDKSPAPNGGKDGGRMIRTPRRQVAARSPAQANYIRAMRDHEMVFGLGPAGTGKTYLAVAMAVSLLNEGRIDRLVLSRPAVEAGERLGFLPGDVKEKVDPYLRPLYDALYDMLPAEQVAKRLERGEIEIAPLAFMRGRTLANSFVILDEAQNTTPMQMKMFLTRLGENARMVIAGDPSQQDLPSGVASGLTDAMKILRDVKGIAFAHFGPEDVVRHELVGRIVQAYEGQGKRETGT